MSGGSSFDDFTIERFHREAEEALRKEFEYAEPEIRLPQGWENVIPPPLNTTSSVHLSEDASPEEKAAALAIGGARWNAGKERWDLLPFDALGEVVKVYTAGAKKYADRNWEKGMGWHICIGATFRHFYKWLLGEDIDPETNCHHLAHAIWNLLALLTYQLRGMTQFDDRAKIGKSE